MPVLIPSLDYQPGQSDPMIPAEYKKYTNTLYQYDAVFVVPVT